MAAALPRPPSVPADTAPMLDRSRIASLLLCIFVFLAPLAATLAAQQTPPDARRAEFLTALERTIAEDAFFSRVDYTWSRRHVEHGLAFVVQRPHKDTPGYADEIADRYAPWFAKLEAMFVRDYVTPLKLVDNGAVPVFVLAIVASEHAYKDHVDVNEDKGLEAARAYYSPERRFALTYREMNSLGLMYELRPALHEMVHALQHRYSASEAGLPESPFFNEGLADYLSHHTQEDPENLEKHPLDYRSLELIGALMLHPRAAAYVLPVKSAVACRSYADVIESVRQQCAKQNMPLDWEFALSAFYAQAHTYMHYLHQSEHAEGARKFVGAALRGIDPPLALEQSLAPVTTLQLDEGFRKYVAGVIKKQRPYFDPTLIPLPTEASAPVVRTASSPGPTPRKRVDPAKTAAALALQDSELSERLAAALARARRCEFGAAKAEFETLSKAADASIASRAKCELERLSKCVALLDASLTQQAQSKARVEFKLDGQSVKGVLVQYGGGKLTVESGGAQREFQLAQLGLVQLAELLPKTDRDAAPELLKFYPYMLVGDAKWKRFTAPDSTEFKKLKQDAVDFYGSQTTLGEAALALSDVANQTTPATPQAARDLLAAIEALWREHKQSPLVASRASALNDLALLGLELAAKTLSVKELVHGDVTELPNDAIRITYRFRREVESQDFVADDLLRDQVWENDQRSGASATFAPRAGGFSGHGDTCWRHVLQFESPLAVRYSVRVSLLEGVELSSFAFALGACADRLGTSLTAVNQSALMSETPNDRRVVPCRGGQAPIELGKTYKIELRHDGRNGSMSVGGAEAATLEKLPMKSGYFFVATLGNLNTHVTEFEIEGKLSPKALDVARSHWIEARLAALAIR